jgi:hypothetical protein
MAGLKGARMKQCYDLKLSSIILGGLQVLWGLGFLFNPGGRLAMLLELWNLRVFFAVFLELSGILLLIGSVFPYRKIRHLGLLLTPMITFPTFGVALTYETLNAVALSLPFVGLAALVIMFLDAKGKPRAKVPG